VVSYAIEKGRTLQELSIDEYCRFSELFENGLYNAITLEASLESKRAIGGTSRERVKEAIESARDALAQGQPAN
jgi:argininosuccinate lyase